MRTEYWTAQPQLTYSYLGDPEYDAFWNQKKDWTIPKLSSPMGTKMRGCFGFDTFGTPPESLSALTQEPIGCSMYFMI
jgi:hypothetical protein